MQLYHEAMRQAVRVVMSQCNQHGGVHRHVDADIHGGAHRHVDADIHGGAHNMLMLTYMVVLITC